MNYETTFIQRLRYKLVHWLFGAELAEIANQAYMNGLRDGYAKSVRKPVKAFRKAE